mmetsp:Transcript_3850/g.11954  ORF Transcript_3850/g.11954 Transcript_3850/m.11954 type:complete len:565 (-) Transcript_3850:11644-13338(-)
MQCDFISTADVGIQFSNGNDDTDFEKLLIELTHLNKPRHHARQAAPIKTYMRSERLPKFMRNVSPVIVGLLRELASDKTTEYGFSPSDIASALDDPFARARSWRRLPDFGISTKQPSISSIIFSQSHTSMLLALLQGKHNLVDDVVPCTPSTGSLQAALWDLSLSEVPEVLLYGESASSCACFAPNNNFCVATGTCTGLITLWDLRKRLEINSRVCHAVFTTGAMGRRESVHNSAIVQLCPVADSFANAHGCLSFQMLSIDDRGQVVIWLVAEVCSESDVSLAQAAATCSASGKFDPLDETVGLRPGGTLGLTCLRSLTVWATGPNVARNDSSQPQNCSFANLFGVGPSVTAFAVSHTSYVVSLSNGHLIKGSSVDVSTEPCVLFSSASSMRAFVRSSQKSISHAKAVCLEFSPFVETLFIVGQLDGGCRLHHLDHATSLFSWPRFIFQKRKAIEEYCFATELVVSDLKWSPHRPSIFFLLHSNGSLHTFDLNITTAGPIHSCALSQVVGVARSPLPPRLAVSDRLAQVAVSFGGAAFIHTFRNRTPEGTACSELASLERISGL